MQGAAADRLIAGREALVAHPGLTVQPVPASALAAVVAGATLEQAAQVPGAAFT
jgi:hypothetical protein